jgi:hypothetical protein
LENFAKNKKANKRSFVHTLAWVGDIHKIVGFDYFKKIKGHMVFIKELTKKNWWFSGQFFNFI